MKYLALLLLLAAITSCKKEEEILSGDIAGIVKTFDQNYYADDDQSGALVTLIDDHVAVDSAFTDENGQFVFADKVFGTYILEIAKEKYVPTYETHTVHHLGGFSPTMTQCYLYETPDFEITLDSLSYQADYYYLIYHLKINGDTVIPNNAYGYILRIYASDEPDVTSEHYSSMGKGYLAQFDESLYGRSDLFGFDANFEALKSGTIYLRIYPLANGQGFGNKEYYPEALGKPSNVISFNWNDLVGQ